MYMMHLILISHNIMNVSFLSVSLRQWYSICTFLYLRKRL